MTDAPAHARPDRVALGAALIIGAVFLMSLQDAVIKLASTGMPLWQIYVLRGVLAIPALAVVAAVRGDRAVSWRRALRPWTTLRAVLLVLMYVFMYAAVPVLNLSTIAAAFYTGPLFITLLSAVLIGEPVGRRRWLAVLVGFAGVLCILRPGLEGFQAAALLPVVSGLCYALAAIATRSRCQGEAPINLALALNLALLATGGLGSLGIALWQPSAIESAGYPFLLGGWAGMGGGEWGLAGVLAALMVGIGIGLAAAYQVAPPVVVATFDYSYLVFATVWSLTLFDEAPDGPTIVGMCLIAGAGLATVRR